MVATVRRRLIVLGSCFGPLDRASQLHRAEHGDEVAGDLRDLAAKAAADFRRDDPQAILRDACDERHHEPHDVRVLRRIPERELAGRGHELRHRAARFHRIRDEPLLHDALADDDVSALERRIDVAARHRPVKRDVVRRFGVERRRPLLRSLLRIDDGRQRLVLDIDQLERVLRLVRRFGDNDGDRVAHVLDRVLGERVIRRGLQIGAGQEPAARNGREDPVRVRRGEHAEHARRRPGARRVDAHD